MDGWLEGHAVCNNWLQELFDIAYSKRRLEA